MIFAFYIREFHKVPSKITWWQGVLDRIFNFAVKSVILILQDKKKTNKLAYKMADINLMVVPLHNIAKQKLFS